MTKILILGPFWSILVRHAFRQYRGHALDTAARAESIQHGSTTCNAARRVALHVISKNLLRRFLGNSLARQKQPQKIKINSGGYFCACFIRKKVKFYSFSGPDLSMCMLPTFCPPTIWANSLEFCGKPYILEADDFLGTCYRKAMTPQKLWTAQINLRNVNLMLVLFRKRGNDPIPNDPHFSKVTHFD